MSRTVWPSLVLSAACVLAPLVFCGCFGRDASNAPVARAAAVSTSGYAWDGETSGFAFAGTSEEIAQVALEALRKHGFLVEPFDPRRDGGAPQIRGKTRAGLDAAVNLKPVSARRVEVRVKVGQYGDRTASETLLNAMRHKLKDAE
ncbi:MAG: DUF3568 domain-containing protein [Planctomycetota bacterium]|nr:DUF3568 domain-containing protein [Planctomycetota bacterium]